MLITKSIEIDAGHRVPFHKGKCRNLHGHRYKIQVGVSGELATKGSDEGMVVDYGDLKTVMMEVIDANFDHSFIMWKDDIFHLAFEEMADQHQQKIVFVDFVPTAENLAKHWYQLLESKFNKLGIQLSFVKVWETPNSTAIYE